MTHIADIRTKTPDELKALALTLKKELFNLRFQAASGESVPVARFRAARRDIARIRTVMSDPQQKTVGATKQAGKAAAAPKAKKTAAAKKQAAE